MNTMSPAEQRLYATLQALVADPQRLLEALRHAGLELVDRRANEMVCRWVSVLERPVPPEADTIIRTITTTNQAGSFSSTHWLDGLRGPNTAVGPQIVAG